MIDPGQTIQLGRTAVAVSRLGFGSAPLGGLLRETSESDAASAVSAARALGLRYFDTAPQYGGGLAEQRLGRALRSEQRNAITVSTKIGKIVELDEAPIGNPGGGFVGAPPHRISYDYSYDGVMRSLEASLRRTGLDRFDIVLIHDVNRKYHGENVFERLDQALAGACKALLKLRDEGVIKAFGPACNENDILLRFLNEVDVDCLMLPQRFTMLDQSAGRELLPLCQRRAVAVLLAAPFDSGVLATGVVEGATYNYLPVTPQIAEAVSAIERLCRDFSVPLPAAALQFGFRQPAVASVVTGMRTAGEVQTNATLMRTKIPAEFWSEFDRIEADRSKGSSVPYYR